MLYKTVNLFHKCRLLSRLNCCYYYIILEIKQEMENNGGFHVTYRRDPVFSPCVDYCGGKITAKDQTATVLEDC